MKRDLYGNSIAFAIRSLDRSVDHSLWDLLSHSLSTRLISFDPTKDATSDSAEYKHMETKLPHFQPSLFHRSVPSSPRRCKKCR